jgi:signal transduction histidine kinase
MDAERGAYREIEIQTADGAIVPIGFSSTDYLGEQGEHEGVIVAYRDLTELKTLQSELLSKERFAAMGRLVAGVAHEIRNPLFGISSIAQLFERDLKTPVHRELVGALLSETKRLNRLVEELLIYGRPMKLRLERCDLRRLWEDVFTMHRAELERRRITITGDYEVRHPVAYLDAHQIRQVFLNLLRNALDTTPDGGAITIRLLIEDRYIIFKVVDSGAGIPSENLDRVFDLFFTTKSRGTGLGLAICKKIVQDHGGEIMIESGEGRGTTVTVKLPYRAIPEEHGR